ncbi:EAL domain-containing protein [Pseudomonas sp. nanlin1]|uniref:EAL domain-containing response regulator n=1 Tax=Pseudomonas sp. nanlin1 TaxID=3040605 RepID=UPI00388D4130
MRSLKILILEDSPFQLMALHQMLNATGVFDVLTADSVARAKQCLRRRGPVDVAICDLQMGGEDGLAFIRHLAAQQGAAALVILSSVERNLIESVAQFARSHGVWVLGALQKPAAPAMLHRLLELYLKRGAKRDPGLPVLEAPPLLGLSAEHLPQLREQWVAHFQPKVTLNAEVVGVEALVRWQHPERGLLAPAQFLPEVTRAGLLDELTWQMLESALALSAQTCLDDGRPLPVAVNISPSLLARGDFVERIMQALRDYQLPAGVLTLELVESHQAVFEHGQIEALLRLRLAGCQLSIDDFGTGESTLLRLMQLPFSELKVPGEFARGAGSDGRKAAIIAGALVMARRMGMRLVVEGVETADDFRALKSLGMPVVQGFHIARPMPAEQLQEWLQEHRVLNDAQDCVA